MKKKACIFTIVKDEDYFLPIWLKYYSKYFDKQDIYVLDHNTIGDSTKNLNCNIIKLENDEVFNHIWLNNTVKKFQVDLFENYEIVVFAEVDEILYSIKKPFDKIIDDFLESSDSHITCMGYEIVQKIGQEKDLKTEDSIAKNRKYWRHHPSYDKSLISKIPLDWDLGFHNIRNMGRNTLQDLYMVHLHPVDAAQMYTRYQSRRKNSKLNTSIIPEKFWTDKEDKNEFIKFYQDYTSEVLEPNRVIEEIPEIHSLKLIEYDL
jgi:hypothetical protein